MLHSIHRLVSVRHQLHLQFYQHRVVVRAIELKILPTFGELVPTDILFTRKFARLNLRGVLPRYASHPVFCAGMK